MSHRLLLASLMLSLSAGACLAEEVRLYKSGETVDPRDVAAILEPAKAPVMKMRSIRLLDDGATASPVAAAAAAAAVTADSAVKPASALALPVQFAFDSTEILPAARAQLDSLAEGIRLLPPSQSVVIEGHTDAAGSEQYNEALSKARAQSVKRYLVSRHGIDGARLRAVGLGEYLPLPGRDPLAPENRRVQFRGGE